MASWSEIPQDLFDAILDRLPCAEDFISCGAVCSSWRSVTVSQKQKQLCRSFNPWLLLPEEEEKKENDDKPSRVCFSTCRKTKFRIELPEAEGRKCLGSGYGWLLTLGLDLNINLLNPLSRAQIPLPSQSTMKVRYPPMHTPENMCRIFIERFAVSSTPSLSNQDFFVVVIYGGFSVLLFSSPGDQTWTTIDTEIGFGDVIYFNDQFYAVRYGELILCEMDTPIPKLTKIASSPPLVHTYDCFLVDISGYLHLVVRQATSRFEVYRFDFHSRKWTPVVDNIGDYALFLGTNASFSVSTSDYPEIRANSIYFTCDNKHFESFASGFWITGVYNYQNKTTKLLYSTNSTFCPPLLFVPAL